MKILKQIALIILFSLIGNLISFLIGLLGVNIPGSIIGMIILFICLVTKLIHYDWIDSVGEFFVNNMGFFFVPAAVKILNNLDELAPIWWKLILIIFISFFITYTLVLLSVKLTLYLQNKKRGEKI